MEDGEARISTEKPGLIYGVAAFCSWGLVPIYFKAVGHIPTVEMLAHRVVWTVVLLAGVLTYLGQWGEFRRCFRERAIFYRLVLTSIFIAINWVGYIYGVNTDRVTETSLGYYILPLVSVLLGVVLLGERLTGAQWVAVGLAALGVAQLVAHAGEVPWIALTLAGSFSMYSLFRKQASVGGFVGLAVETTLLCPLALGYLVWMGWQGELGFGSGGARMDGLVMLSGLVTTIPLYCFGEATRRLPLSTLGFLQYISPTVQLLLAVQVYQEKFDAVQAFSFGCIWLALAVFTVTAVQQRVAAVSG